MVAAGRHRAKSGRRQRADAGTSTEQIRCGPARVELRAEGRGVVLMIHGELDVTSCRGLGVVLGLAERFRRPVEANLVAVTFADSFGLGPLLPADASSKRATCGVDVVFGAVSRPVARVLDLLDVAHGVVAEVGRSRR